tara:strand:- start:2514 stop:2699 length:186 start_codon:yes stop_codon:yes gene_type:complete
MNRILPQLLLVLLILQGCSAFQNYSIYELLSNQEFSENTDELSVDEKPDIESVPKKVIINE